MQTDDEEARSRSKGNFNEYGVCSRHIFRNNKATQPLVETCAPLQHRAVSRVGPGKTNICSAAWNEGPDGADEAW
jgi:hypothetical protein